MKINTLILFLMFILSACGDSDKTNKNNCLVLTKKFINQSNDIEIFKGFTMEARGHDINGDRYLRPLEYKRKDGQLIKLPSMQQTTNSTSPSIDDFDYHSFAQVMNVDSLEAKEFTLNRIKKLVDYFNSLQLYRVHSQLNKGEFIEFELMSGCSIWYKTDKAYLNKTYQNLFDKAEKFAPNWYVIRGGVDVPILTKHPENVHIDK